MISIKAKNKGETHSLGLLDKFKDIILQCLVHFGM